MSYFTIYFEYCPKNPGHKLYLRFRGKKYRRELVFYFGTNSHCYGKFYYFKELLYGPRPGNFQKRNSK